MKKYPCLPVALLAGLILSCPGGILPRAVAAAPYQATGIKISEVDSTRAIVWSRLTREPDRVGVNGPRPTYYYEGKLRRADDNTRPDLRPEVRFPPGVTVDNLEGAAPGSAGQTRVAYRIKGTSAWQYTAWAGVDPEKDFTQQHWITDLVPASAYEIRVEARAAAGAPESSAHEGQFRTAPTPATVQTVRFTATTGHNYYSRDLHIEGWKIYDQMLRRAPDFMVHTGDILYYDQWAKSLPLARWMWQQSFSMPNSRRFYSQVPTYFMKDDHETWVDDAYPTMKTRFMGDFTYAQGQAVFLEQVGMGDKTYRTYRWGRDLQIWLPEGRDYRSANPDPDGPDKTIWGAEQKAWFKRTVQESNATFRVLISPTPLVGPDRGNKNDNHANRGFTHEGNELRTFLAEQNMIVVCGDRHWQYVSVDPRTGLREYCTGPSTNAHAGGWPQGQKEPEHLYLNVVGGFVEGTVERRNGVPTLTFRHFSVDGELLHEDAVPAR